MSLATNVSNLAQSIAAALKATRTLVNGNAADNTALTTTAKANLVVAINEVNAKTASAGASIDDTTPRTTTVYSSSKTDTQVATAVANIVNGAPAAYDTLKEISDYIATDTTAATTVTNALANRVRFDAAQTYTTGQATQLVSNLTAAGIASAVSVTTLTTNVGDTTTDFVAAFTTALNS